MNVLQEDGYARGTAGYAGEEEGADTPCEPLEEEGEEDADEELVAEDGFGCTY